MKLRKGIFISAFLALISLTSCSLINLGESEDDGPRRVVDSYLVDTRETTYNLGDTYKVGKKTDYSYVFSYSDKTKEEIPIEKINGFENLLNKDTGVTYQEATFVSSGLHYVNLSVRLEGETRIGAVRINIKSGIESNYTLKRIETNNDLAITKGFTFNEINPNLQLKFIWNTGSKDVIEYISSSNKNLSTTLTSGTSQNLMDEALIGGKTYTFSAYLKENPSIKLNKTFTVSTKLGHYKMDESSLIYEDIHSVAPHSGKTNLLVILIDLEPGNVEGDDGYEKIEWNDDFVKRANDYFFGKKEDTPNNWNSLKTYFETTSLNALEISGIVSEVYKADPNKYTMRSILNSYRPYRALHEVFVDAIHYIQSARSDIDWSSFDKNDDGYLDNLHFITNASYTTTRLGEYGRSLWPHKYEFEIYETPNLNNPVGKVYETTSLGHFTDPNTIIHEQGHVFGIPDYYDYGYTGADYIGCLDMQSHNVFDWNAFSKFSVGWAKPYVVDGDAETTTIKLNSSALTNECIVVPSNHNKYNGSAFDEYFLLELYTMDGNNAYDWKRYYGTSTTAAIKIFHVDARLYDIQNRKIPTFDEILNAQKDQMILGTNNSYNYKDYGGGYANPDWADFKTLAIMQNGGVNTFGELDGNSASSYDFLSMKDLFHTGNSFEFDDYANFLSKTGKTITTMDNGDIFPYRITIQNIKNTEAIVTIAKI